MPRTQLVCIISSVLAQPILPLLRGNTASYTVYTLQNVILYWEQLVNIVTCIWGLVSVFCFCATEQWWCIQGYCLVHVYGMCVFNILIHLNDVQSDCKCSRISCWSVGHSCVDQSICELVYNGIQALHLSQWSMSNQFGLSKKAVSPLSIVKRNETTIFEAKCILVADSRLGHV